MARPKKLPASTQEQTPTPSTTPTRSTTPNAKFLVKCTIIYRIRNMAGIEERRSKDVVFPLDEKSVAAPQYMLSNFLVPAYLNKNVGPHGTAWLGQVERKIHKIVNRENPESIEGIPLRHMTVDQLEQYVAEWELDVNIHEFHSVSKMRQMVQLILDDPTGFKVQVEEYRASRKKELPGADDMRRNASVVDYTDEFDAIEKGIQKKTALVKPEITGVDIGPGESVSVATSVTNPFDTV